MPVKLSGRSGRQGNSYSPNRRIKGNGVHFWGWEGRFHSSLWPDTSGCLWPIALAVNREG